MINGSLFIKGLLSSNWNNANTASRTPQFSEYKDKKRLAGYKNYDWVLTYKRTGTENIRYLSNLRRELDYNMSIDLRTNVSENQLILMAEEVKRIIRANVNYIIADATYGTIGQQIKLEPKIYTYFSNSENSELFHNYRQVIEINIKSYIEAV